MTGKIILPDSLAPKRSEAAHLRGQALATLDQVVNIAGNMIGPVAITLDEAMGKIARLEDKLGITDESVAVEGDVAKGTAYLTPHMTALEERIVAIEAALKPQYQNPKSSVGGDI